MENKAFSLSHVVMMDRNLSLRALKGKYKVTQGRYLK
jgi:hypothetical protein